MNLPGSAKIPPGRLKAIPRSCPCSKQPTDIRLCALLLQMTAKKLPALPSELEIGDMADGLVLGPF